MTSVITAAEEIRLGPTSILTAREERAVTQRDLQKRFGVPLLSVTVVMPGPVKDSPVSRRLLVITQQQVRKLIQDRDWRILACMEALRAAGPEAIYAVAAPAEDLKAAAMALEDTHALGRLWDLDVIADSMRALSRPLLDRPPRRCLVCEQPAKECARNRRHPLAELLAVIETRVSAFDRQSESEQLPTSCAIRACTLSAEHIGELAYQSLLTEVRLTPKPGLVDQRNTGAHRDMDLGTFERSAGAIASWLPRFVTEGREYAWAPAHTFLSLLRPTGILCEQAMIQATAGINTHKGSIFALGLLCAVIGRLQSRGEPVCTEWICRETAEVCHDLVEQELECEHNPVTAGERLFREFGLTGARGEAASGYATVRRHALPVLRLMRQAGVDGETALLQATLHLLAFNNDTNLVSRGGMEGLTYVRDCAQRLLRQGGVFQSAWKQRLESFDDDLIARNLSPGGTADLISVAWFLSCFPESPEDSGSIATHFLSNNQERL
jgi:holo-ACP synthase/triphosphoribosyl-dephospho-CoA synthase